MTKKKELPPVMFSTNNDGRWFKREWSSQCLENVFLYGQCQGVEGHKGLHWNFDASGNFCWGDNKNDPKEDGCSGSTPPDHKNYKTPLQMQKHYHLSHYKDSEVKDPKEIARLEKGKLKNHESLTRPVSDETAKKLGLDKALKKIQKKRR